MAVCKSFTRSSMCFYNCFSVLCFSMGIVVTNGVTTRPKLVVVSTTCSFE